MVSTRELEDFLSDPGLQEFITAKGDAFLTLFHDYSFNALAPLKSIAGFKVSKKPLGTIHIEPKLSENEVTWLNIQMKRKGILGRVLQSGDHSIYDVCRLNGFELSNPKKSKRTRH